MKFSKKKGYEGTVRKVWSDDKTVCFGLIGTVGDLLQEEIFEFCDASSDTWAFVPFANPSRGARFGSSRESVLPG